jgi:3-oxoacyl-[acyl-carrier-protein] synthase II
MRKPENRRVVVVGCEVSTPLGHGLDTSWTRAVRCESGIGWLSRFDAADYAVKVAGEIPDFDPLSYDFITERERHFWHAEFIPLVMALSHDLVENAGIVIDDRNAHRIGALVGSAMNGNDAFQKNLNSLRIGGPLKVSPFCLPNICGNMPVGKTAMLLGLKGPTMSPATACATGNHCIAESAKIIQRGDADIMIAGGVDLPLLPVVYYGFGNMRALVVTREGDRAYRDPALASRPFSRDRKGFVLSEGAGLLLLSSLENAMEMELPILAEIAGVYMNSDAYHYTNPLESAIAACAEGALRDAELTPRDVDYINAHGTSTKIGDETEVACLRQVFGAHLESVPISSNKSQIGHALAASAAIEASFIIRGMQENILLPTLNYDPDPAFETLDFVPNRPRRQQVDVALSNSFGFGGTNCCIVLKRWRNQ